MITVDEQYLDKLTGDYRLKVKLENSKAFLGVKAVVVDARREEVVYIPLEISSLLGEISKISAETLIIGGVYLVIIIAAVVVLSARFARRGYRPIASE